MHYFKEKLQNIKSDDRQYQAYLADSSVVVSAGPGSGKTTVLTMKIIRLLRDYIKEPRGLACVTFSKEAANEFQKRLYKLGYVKRNNVFLGTVHSFCIAEIILPFANLYNYNIPLPLKIISEKQKEKIYLKVLKDLNIEPGLVSIKDMDKERNMNINGISEVEIPSFDIALKVAKEYEKRLFDNGEMDFEAIVKNATLLIQKESYVRRCLNAKFPWILVDEYQDLGRPLHEMILSLYFNTDIQIFAVGDPDQSIYGFTGAIPDYLNELHTMLNINKIELKNNYRSNQDIIDASEIVLNPRRSRNYIAGSRTDENAEFYFYTCEEELVQQYEVVTNKIIPACLKKGISYGEIAVIVASNAIAKNLSKHFEVNKIPFYISKYDFKRSDIVKWLEKCATWVEDKTNESFNEINDFWSILLINHGISIRRKDKIVEKKKLYNLLVDSKKFNKNLYAWLVVVLEKLNIEVILESSSIYPDENENLSILRNLASQGEFKNWNIAKFARLGKPDNQVTITTRHSSKGLEFEAIIMLGMEDDRFPGFWVTDRRQLEEAHRLCFVCVSRAKRVCCLVRSKYYTLDTRNGPWRKDHKKSRFWVQLEDAFGNDENQFEMETNIFFE